MRLTTGLHGYVVLRFSGGLEIRLHNLTCAVILMMVAVVGGVALLTTGSTDSTFSDLVGLFDGDAVSGDVAFAIADVRLPRILMGFMAGWCIALTGAMLQSLAQNPLADPGLLGLSQGSLVVIMLVLVLFPGLPLIFTPCRICRWVGGGRAVDGTGRASSFRGLGILLMGIAVETTLSAVTSILILYAPPEQSHAISSWLAGSLFHSDWSAVGSFAAWFVISILAILVIGRKLRSLDLGDHMALALGRPFISPSRSF